MWRRVANALPLVRERADWVTPSRNGEGVVELIDKLIADDLADLEGRLSRHSIPVGLARRRRGSARPTAWPFWSPGPRENGKSTFATGFLERLAGQGYQFCIVDPEGDYALLEAASCSGQGAPSDGGGALEVLEQPNRNVVVNLLASPSPSVPAFFRGCSRSSGPSIAHRSSSLDRGGRGASPLARTVGSRLGDPAPDAVSMMLVTVHPEHVSPACSGPSHRARHRRSADETLRASARRRARRPRDSFPAPRAGRALLCDGAPKRRIRSGFEPSAPNRSIVATCASTPR